MTESFPFDNDTLVFKVAGKMFALASLEKHPLTVNLKCDPEKALELREQFEEIKPGYHMNKQHWNTVTTEGKLGYNFICELIDNSYNLIVQSLSKKQKQEFGFI